MKLTIVTGVSGAGKSTLVRELLGAAWVQSWDIDGEGTPDVAHLDWLRWRAAQLIHDAVTASEETTFEHFVICGVIWPHELIDSSAWPEVEDAKADVRFLLLDVPHKVIRERLAPRLEGKRAGDRRALLRYNRQLAGVLRRQVSNQRCGDILAAHRMAPAEIAQYVLGGGW